MFRLDIADSGGIQTPGSVDGLKRDERFCARHRLSGQKTESPEQHLLKGKETMDHNVNEVLYVNLGQR